MEAGVKWDLGGFTHTVSIFDLENTSVVQDPATLRYCDDGEQTNRGVEWSMFGSLTPSLRLLGGITYTRPVLEKSASGLFDANTARGVPKWNAILSAEWDVPGVRGLTVSTLIMHSSSLYLDSANTLKAPKYTRYDLGARYGMSVYERDVTLRASLENVENRAYWAGSFNEGFASIGQPRTLKVSATIDF